MPVALTTPDAWTAFRGAGLDATLIDGRLGIVLVPNDLANSEEAGRAALLAWLA